MSPSAPHIVLHSRTEREAGVEQWGFEVQADDGNSQLAVMDEEPDVHGERLELLAVVRGLESLEQPSRVTLITSSRYVDQGIAYGLAEWNSSDWQWEYFGQMLPVKNCDLWRRLDRALKIHRLERRIIRYDAPHDAECEEAEAPQKLEWDSGDELADCPVNRSKSARRASHALRGPHFRPQPHAAAPRGQSAAAWCDSQVTTHDRPAAAFERATARAPEAPSHTQRSPRLSARRSLLRIRRATGDYVERLWLRCAQLGTSLLPCPWID